VDLPTGELASRLAAYVDILNAIYDGTGRRFVFEAADGVVVTDVPPMSGWCCPGGEPLPEEGFEIWVRARFAGAGESGGGTMSMDTSGAGVAAGLRWMDVWDVTALAPGSPQLEDFWRQIDHLAHEIAHIFGAGISEYYSLLRVRDRTGVEPILDIDFGALPGDPYWTAHADFVGDVLLHNVWNAPVVGAPTDVSSLVAAARFSPLSRAVIATGMRNASALQQSLPDLSHVRVVTRDAVSGAKLAGAGVTAWAVETTAPYDARILVHGRSGRDGLFHFDWGATSPFSNAGQLRLVKASAPGYTGAAAWASVFDAQAAKLLDGRDTLRIDLSLEPTPPAAGVIDAVVLEPNQPNPFNPTTTIRFHLEKAAHVTVAVFDARGVRVVILHDGHDEAGEHVLHWDGTTRTGRKAASGVYFCRLRAGESTRTRRLVLVR
jgi:hypothetical protein